jgi:hypothetical protein
MAVTTTDVEKRNITITLANEDGEEYRMETKTTSRYFIETFFIDEKSFTWYYNKHGKGKVKVEYVNGDEEMVAYIDHKETTWGNGGNWVSRRLRLGHTKIRQSSTNAL